mgnify:CR=1 FL=1
MTSEKKKVFGLSFLSVFLWASAFPLTKVAQQQFTSIPLGFLRCTVAAIFLIIIGKCCHIRLPQKKHIPLFFVSGGLGFTGYMITFNTGILTLTSATSSIIIAVTPILTAIVASNLYKEKIKPIGWAAIAAAFIGVLILLLWEGVFSINIGLIWTVGAAIVFCGYNIMTRKLSAMGYNALEIVTYSMICGAILLGFWAGDGLHQLFHAPEAAARQIDDIFRGIHIGDLLVGPVKSLSAHVCFLSALFLRHSLLPGSAAAQQQRRGEKQGQYTSIHRVSSFRGIRTHSDPSLSCSSLRSGRRTVYSSDPRMHPMPAKSHGPEVIAQVSAAQPA